MKSSKLSVWKGYHLSILCDPFYQKWCIKGWMVEPRGGGRTPPPSPRTKILLSSARDHLFNWYLYSERKIRFSTTWWNPACNPITKFVFFSCLNYEQGVVTLALEKKSNANFRLLHKKWHTAKSIWTGKETPSQKPPPATRVARDRWFPNWVSEYRSLLL